MPNALVGIFIVLHGLVHLFYFAVSQRFFELEKPIVGWPERSWLFSTFLEDSATRSVASALYAVATLIFVMSGAGVLFRAEWRPAALVIAAVFSSVIIFLFWDGKFQQMPDKGFVGVLINIVVLGALFLVAK